MTRTLLRFSSFAFVLLCAVAVHAESTSEENSFSSTFTSPGTFGLARHAPIAFISKRVNTEDLQSVDGEEVLGKVRWLELMSCNYIGHDPKQLRHYGPMGPDFLAASGNDGLINSEDTSGSLTIAVQALQNRTRNLIKVLGEGAQLKVRIAVPGRLALGIQLLFD